MTERDKSTLSTSKEKPSRSRRFVVAGLLGALGLVGITSCSNTETTDKWKLAVDCPDGKSPQIANLDNSGFGSFQISCGQNNNESDRSIPNSVQVLSGPGSGTDEIEQKNSRRTKNGNQSFVAIVGKNEHLLSSSAPRINFEDNKKVGATIVSFTGNSEKIVSITVDSAVASQAQG